MAAINISTTATLIKNTAQTKNAAVFVNLSDVDIYIAPRINVTATAGADTGIRIKSGDTFAIAPQDYTKLQNQSAWYAIHADTGDKVLTVEIL